MGGAEDMRRDGYEFSVSPPRVVMRCAVYGRLLLVATRVCLDGWTNNKSQRLICEGLGGCRQEGREKLEPIEEVICEVADEFSGAVIEALTVRKGEVSHHAVPQPSASAL